MVARHGRIDVERLAAEIRGTLSANQLGIHETEFVRLSENIARAIALAVSAHAETLHRATVEYGEEERPG